MLCDSKLYLKVLLQNNKILETIKEEVTTMKKKSASSIHQKFSEVPVKMNTSSTSTNTALYILSKVITTRVIPNINPAKSNTKAFYRHVK